MASPDIQRYQALREEVWNAIDTDYYDGYRAALDVLPFLKGCTPSKTYRRDFANYPEERLKLHGLTLDDLPKDSVKSVEAFFRPLMHGYSGESNGLADEMIGVFRQQKDDGKSDREIIEGMLDTVKAASRNFTIHEKDCFITKLFDDIGGLLMSEKTPDVYRNYLHLIHTVAVPLMEDIYRAFIADSNESQLSREGLAVRDRIAVGMKRGIEKAKAASADHEKARGVRNH